MKNQRGVSILLFLVGLFFLFDSQATITGAFIGSSIASSISPFIGICSMVLAGILFVTEEGGLEKKIRLTSNLKKDQGLVRYAVQATNNQELQKEMNHLLKELSRGHTGAGKGTKHLEGTNIFYMRGNKGARLFYRRNEGGYEIVGKADGTGKKGNEHAVMKKLKEIYDH